jgi:hypothetical protein
MIVIRIRIRKIQEVTYVVYFWNQKSLVCTCITKRLSKLSHENSVQRYNLENKHDKGKNICTEITNIINDTS